MKDNEKIHKKEVKAAVERALSAGLDQPDNIWRELMGADPRLAYKLLKEIQAKTTDSANIKNLAQRESAARRLIADTLCLLPAPDPVRSQWWFILDSVVWISRRTHELASSRAAAFLGAPTVGQHFSSCYGGPVTILDADDDVIKIIEVPAGCIKQMYDAYDDLHKRFRKKHSIVVIDPPWYPDITRLFISRALELLDINGIILCILPSRLTRPGLIQEHTKLLQELLEANFEIVSLESQVVTYLVPPFEAVAYKDLPGFNGRPWRQGDLLILRTSSNTQTLKIRMKAKSSTIETFAQKPTAFRVFLLSALENQNLNQWIMPIPEFDQTVSRRGIPIEKITIWTSKKRAGQIKNAFVARKVLQSWEDGRTPEETEKALYKVNFSAKEAKNIIEQFKNVLELWTDEIKPTRRRTTSELKKILSHFLSDLASRPSKRKYEFRDDGFRLEFQRDRDRILWSHGLKRLINKSQVFPVGRDDHLRRRLSHSIEVMQLAATIARAFALDPDLTEAGALAHDLGHTSFGHAGEHALNSILNEIEPALGGFNHYEHGVDVVRWLEDVYQSPGIGGFPGLNLTPETEECIFKHMFYRKGHKVGQHEIFIKSKHKDLQDNFCHLEGQAIRIADKISYLISDLEDGIRMGVFTLDHLKKCRLFGRPPIDICPAKDEPLFERFISQRRALLKVLMEDVIKETDRRLAHNSTIQSVRNARDYTVTFSSEIQEETKEIWDALQKGILHRNSRVIRANLETAKIVSELFLVYVLAPALIEEKFVRNRRRLKDTEYMRHYESLIKEKSVYIPSSLVTPLFLKRMIGGDFKRKGDKWIVPLQHVIRAKDYVASLTDTQTKLSYREILQGSESL